KDLTAKKQPPKSKLRFPDKKNKKKRSKPKKKDLISVVKKKRNPPKEDPKTATVTRKQNLGSNIVTTGIGGTGSNAGSGAYGSRFGVGNFPYAYYIEALKNKISSSWYNALVSPGSSGRHVATVYFRILRSGQIRDLVLKQKSGIRTLDLSSLRAVENAAPFPPLPNQFTDRYLGVYFDFVWEKK
ncbi:MAG: TonB C-terminal domain-containing protein, partial [bacterium]|nr:TonB C-terminal domain-containing protein [bacterium]